MDLEQENLKDVDTVLVEMIAREDRIQPFQDGDAIAVRAIIELSRAGNPRDARLLMSDLTVIRKTNRR